MAKLVDMTCSQDKKELEVLADGAIEEYRDDLGYGWEVKDSTIEKTFKFESYQEGIDFANGVANIAKEQNHHPDITLSYNTVTVTLTTHKVGGLTRNDFIVAAKVETL